MLFFFDQRHIIFSHALFVPLSCVDVNFRLSVCETMRASALMVSANFSFPSFGNFHIWMCGWYDQSWQLCIYFYYTLTFYLWAVWMICVSIETAVGGAGGTASHPRNILAHLKGRSKQLWWRSYWQQLYYELQHWQLLHNWINKTARETKYFLRRLRLFCIF